MKYVIHGNDDRQRQSTDNRQPTTDNRQPTISCTHVHEQLSLQFFVILADKEVSEDEEEVKHETFEDSSHQTDSGNSNDSMERET